MPTPQHKHSKEPLLNSVADFIGSTLGTIASKASEIPEAVSHNSLVRTATREGKSLVRRSRTVVRKIGNSAPKKLKTRKLAKTARRKLRAAKTAARRVMRSSSSRKRIASRARARK